MFELISDCRDHGTEAISLGGGEPFEFAGLFDLLERTKGLLFRSMTTNGLQLDENMESLVAAEPDKVHISIHFPERPKELARVIRQVNQLRKLNMDSGVNLLVMQSQLDAAAHAARQLWAAGIENDRIVYLPMRGSDTPSPQQVSHVAGSRNFQSMTCLNQCGNSPRFCSIAWDRSVAWCSYTTARRKLSELSYRGLEKALDGLGLIYCGANDE